MSNDLPNGWARAKVGNVGHSQLGKMLDRAKRTEGTPHLYLRNINVRWSSFELSDLLEMPFLEKEVDRFSILDDDVLICEGGEPGRSAVWSNGDTKIKFQKALHRVRLFGGIAPQWLVHNLRLDATTGKLERHFTGTTIKHFTGRALKKYEFPLPPINEQHRIVAKIDGLQARASRAREALEAIPGLLGRFRQSVLAAAFRGDLSAQWRAEHPDVEPAAVLLDRIRAERKTRWIEAKAEKARARAETKATKAGKPWTSKDNQACLARERTKAENQADSRRRAAHRGEVAEHTAESLNFADPPATWAVARLYDILELQPGYAFKSKSYSEDGIRLLRGTNIIPRGIRWSSVVFIPQADRQEYIEYELHEGDIVIAMDRPLISTGLKIARLSASDTPSLLLQRVGRFLPHGEIDSTFLYYFLQGPTFRHQIAGQATGTQLPHVSGNDIESCPVVLPPLNEQRVIGLILDVMMRSIAQLQTTLQGNTDSLEKLNQSILAKAFRGELVPQDPSDEPASELLARIQAERAAAAATSKKPKRSKRDAANKTSSKKAASRELA